MALFKEYKKKSVSDPRQTFEATVNDKLSMYNDVIMKENSLSKIAYEDRVDYLLEIAPFIQHYYTDNADQDNIVANEMSNTTAPSTMQHYIVTQQSSQRKGAIYESYMKHIGESNNVEKEINDVMCVKCNVSRIYDMSESVFTCPVCAETVYTLDSVSIPSTPSVSEQSEITPYYAYKRSNHFSEWLSQLQGKETTYIPDSVYDSLLNELKKERITEIDDITHAKIRTYLKKLRLNKYYEHIPHIIRKLKGVPPPKIKPEIEETLRQMFYLIQEPFKKHCPKNRKNFLSYSYTLYKMSEILGEDEMLEQFTLPLLKSRDKLNVQDKIWKGICSELNWEFIPTI